MGVAARLVTGLAASLLAGNSTIATDLATGVVKRLAAGLAAGLAEGVAVVRRGCRGPFRAVPRGLP